MTAPPDAIVVLGCRVEPSGALSRTLQRRADWAAVAFATELGRWVIPSGGRRWGDHVEAEQLARYLIGRAVPESAIFPELLSLTTAENAIFCAEIVRRLRARRALVVTCAWHMPRALACFRTLGVEALPLAVPSAPSDVLTSLYRSTHELVSSRIDAWNLGRIDRLRRRAGRHPFDTGEGAT